MKTFNNFILERLKSYQYVNEKLILNNDTKLEKDIIGFNVFSNMLEHDDDLINDYIDNYVGKDKIQTDIELHCIDVGMFYKIKKYDTKYCYCFYVYENEHTNNTEYYQAVISKEKNNQINIYIGYTDETGNPIDDNELYVLKHGPRYIKKNEYDKIKKFIIACIEQESFDFDDDRFDFSAWQEWLKKWGESI